GELCTNLFDAVACARAARGVLCGDEFRTIGSYCCNTSRIWCKKNIRLRGTMMVRHTIAARLKNCEAVDEVLSGIFLANEANDSTDLLCIEKSVLQIALLQVAAKDAKAPIYCLR